jgi:hypothetical protein
MTEAQIYVCVCVCVCTLRYIYIDIYIHIYTMTEALMYIYSYDDINIYIRQTRHSIISTLFPYYIYIYDINILDICMHMTNQTFNNQHLVPIQNQNPY